MLLTLAVGCFKLTGSLLAGATATTPSSAGKGRDHSMTESRLAGQTKEQERTAQTMAAGTVVVGKVLKHCPTVQGWNQKGQSAAGA